MKNNHATARARQRRPMASPLAIAANRAALLQPGELASITRPTRTSINALMQGRATHDDWAIARGAYLIALAIERSGIVRGQLAAIQAAGQALMDAYHRATRAGNWSAPALHHHERDRLDFLADLFKGQLQHISRGELAAISKKAMATMKTQGLHVERKAA